MKKLICILLAAATTAGCEKDDPTRYDMSQGRVCFPGAAPNETAEYPGYSNSDSTFYASMTFKQQPEGVAEAVIEVPVKLIGGASGSDRKIGVRVLEEGTTAQPGQYEILGAEVPAGKTYGAIRIEVAKSAELDTQQRELTLCLTDSPDLRVGPLPESQRLVAQQAAAARDDQAVVHLQRLHRIGGLFGQLVDGGLQPGRPPAAAGHLRLGGVPRLGTRLQLLHRRLARQGTGLVRRMEGRQPRSKAHPRIRLHEGPGGNDPHQVNDERP